MQYFVANLNGGEFSHVLICIQKINTNNLLNDLMVYKPYRQSFAHLMAKNI